VKHCLVADESAVLRKVARRILQDFEYRVSEAENGERALSLCETEMPDAVLVSADMPVMDGYEFVKHLRDMPGGHSPRVVFCFLENDAAHIARAHAAGADDYVLKPFDKDVLRAMFQP
jgi:two-component system chemotaxis response regulator CheY